MQERATLSQMNGSDVSAFAARRPANVRLRNGNTDPEIRSVAACINLVDLNPSNRGPYEHDHDQGRHPDLLQGLGHRTARCLQPRLATLLRCIRRPDVLSGLARLPLSSPTTAAATAVRASPGPATTWTPTPTTSPSSSRSLTSRMSSMSATPPAAAKSRVTSPATAPSEWQRPC